MHSFFRGIIKRIIDDGPMCPTRFFKFKAFYYTTLVVGFIISKGARVSLKRCGPVLSKFSGSQIVSEAGMYLEREKGFLAACLNGPLNV